MYKKLSGWEKVLMLEIKYFRNTFLSKNQANVFKEEYAGIRRSETLIKINCWAGNKILTLGIKLNIYFRNFFQTKQGGTSLKKNMQKKEVRR